jgi:hypothetical protein
MKLGDMLTVEMPPVRLVKALAVIADRTRRTPVVRQLVEALEG